MVEPQVLVPVVALFLLGIMVIWAIHGELWKKKAATIDFKKIYRQLAMPPGTGGDITTATSGQDAIDPGEAEHIRNYLFQGTNIPGWSVAPPVKPTEQQQRERARIEAEKPLRLATQAKAVQDLRRRLGGIATQDISLASWSERTWMDSALGCAQPGEVMVPARLPGWMFVFRSAKDPTGFFIYNATRDGKRLTFCRRERNSTETQ